MHERSLTHQTNSREALHIRHSGKKPDVLVVLEIFVIHERSLTRKTDRREYSRHTGEKQSTLDLLKSSTSVIDERSQIQQPYRRVALRIRYTRESFTLYSYWRKAIHISHTEEWPNTQSTQKSMSSPTH